ncbi:MAG TPA: hypothetical protein VFR03_21380 [Thermoanaerobaculia bacterium]|nr:hypothetical protein [Thermoanaerobaculia bacterium]
MGLLRRLETFLALLLPLSLLLHPRPAGAVALRYANIDWCASGSNQQSTTNTITFHVQIAESGAAGKVVGGPVYETFDLGDGTSSLISLYVTEIHPEEDWFLATGSVVHQYSPYGDALVYAGLEGCCRIDELNNRSGEPYRVKVAVSRNAPAGGCSPKTFVPPILSLYAVPGRPVDYVVPGFSTFPILCRLAEDGEAGGGPSPEGMRIGSQNCVITWGIPATEGTFPFWTAQVQVEDYGTPESHFSGLVGSAATDFLLRFVPDVTPPVCQVDHLDSGPPTRLFIYVRDAQTGLASIDVLSQTNATVFLPAADGTKEPVTVTATKIDESQPARVELRVRDLAGNVTDCDPVLTSVVRTSGRPESQVFPDVPPEEHFVTVHNGDPGLKQLQIDVNGWRFTVDGLKSGEERTIDVSRAVVPGVSSTVTLTSHGKPGGEAAIMIWDGH